uniref:hypothetical protein n=1 Tax=Nocardia farcinica TaxID=37329 RepID=UPI002458AE7A
MRAGGAGRGPRAAKKGTPREFRGLGPFDLGELTGSHPGVVQHIVVENPDAAFAERAHRQL